MIEKDNSIKVIIFIVSNLLTWSIPPLFWMILNSQTTWPILSCETPILREGFYPSFVMNDIPLPIIYDILGAA